MGASEDHQSSGIHIQWRQDQDQHGQTHEAARQLSLAFKVVQRLSQNWRVLNGGANLMSLVLAGCAFRDGILQPGEIHQMEAAADQEVRRR